MRGSLPHQYLTLYVKDFLRERVMLEGERVCPILNVSPFTLESFSTFINFFLLF